VPGGDSWHAGWNPTRRLRLTSEETIRRARSGDPRAFEAIYRDHHRRVWALASRWEGDPDRAADLLQETFVEVWRALPGFRGDSALSTWIHTIALRTAIDRARSRGRRSDHEQGVGSSETSPPTPAFGASLDMERAIAALPDGQRRMLVLHAIEGYRCHEIAERLGVSIGTVQSQVFRARRKLKEVLNS
jgi:RNA polymerase sigma factor (sigma-70 family)